MSEPQQKTWSVRGVPPELIERVSVVAKLNAMTLGAWVTQVLQDAVDRFDEAGSLQEQRELRAEVQQLREAVRRLEDRNKAEMASALARVTDLEKHTGIKPKVEGEGW